MTSSKSLKYRCVGTFLQVCWRLALGGLTKPCRSGNFRARGRVRGGATADYLLITGLDLSGVKKAGAVMDCQQMDLVLPNPVDDAVSYLSHFAMRCRTSS